MMKIVFRFIPRFQVIRQYTFKAFDPEVIVDALDRHIIGQTDAKRAVAIAFRNRFRRRQLPQDIQKEIMPANILMKGPTGCGKTEIARRIASLTQSPFVKVEATRYTEVGIVGANAHSMIRELLDVAIAQEKETALRNIRERAVRDAEKETLSQLDLEYNEENLTKLRNNEFDTFSIHFPADILNYNKRASTKLNQGSDESYSPDEMLNSMLTKVMTNIGQVGSKKNMNKTPRQLTVKEALQQYIQYYCDQLIDENEIISIAKIKTEQEGTTYLKPNPFIYIIPYFIR
jgi:ATP-dependent HslUV protease ATP-binding subunit HslU